MVAAGRLNRLWRKRAGKTALLKLSKSGRSQLLDQQFDSSQALILLKFVVGSETMPCAGL
jgi:hypothetical protein